MEMRLIRENSTKQKVSSVTVLFLGMLFLSSSSVWADEKDEMIQKLIQRVDQLEKKVEDLTWGQGKPAVTVPDEIVKEKVEAILMEKEGHGGFMKMPKISGYIDTTYNYNFNKPASQTTKLGTPGTSTAGINLSSYVTKANDITFNTAHLAFNGSLKDGIGYTIELDAGSDANVNTPTSGAGAADDFDLQEAYLTSPLFETGINLKVGKFVTLEGIEVIESPLNPNISRGHLFGMAEPFTHVGFLLSRP
ncbi:MAG: outer membrane beta-barrel protein, partial [Candidatus Omnitrophota bacterium]|nr:outer membrane beta-barrel protein [Candidatus Omnitrophota bacterium]